MNLKGSVQVQAVVARDGTVKKVKLIGGNPVFAEAAQEAVMTAVDRLGFHVRMKTEEGMKGARIAFLGEVSLLFAQREQALFALPRFLQQPLFDLFRAGQALRCAGEFFALGANLLLL